MPGGSRKKRGVTYDELCELALALPGVETGRSYGTPALKVKGKLLVRLKEDGKTVVLHVPFDEREILLAADPDVFYLTDHYAGYPTVLVRLARVRRNQLVDLLELSWRSQAPGTLVAALDACAVAVAGLPRVESRATRRAASERAASSKTRRAS